MCTQPEIEEWSSWDEEAPTSIKIEGGNGSVSPTANEIDEEPDYFKDMAPTIRKTQKVHVVCVLDPHWKPHANMHTLMAILWTFNPFQTDSVGYHILHKGNVLIRYILM